MKKAYLILVVGIVAVSTGAIFARLAQVQASSIMVSAYRMTVSALIIGTVAITRYKENVLSNLQKHWKILFLGGLFLACHFITWISSLEFTSVANSVVLVTTTPIWVTVFSVIFYKEPLKKTTLIGLFIALAGSVLISFSDRCKIVDTGLYCSSLTELSQNHLIGDLLALTGALFASGYLLVGKRMRKSIDLIPYSGILYSFSAIILIIIVLVTKGKITGYAPMTYVWLISIALIPQLIGHNSLNWCLKHVSATTVSTALLAEPIGATILAALLFMEYPGIIKVLSAFIILVGILIVTYTEGSIG